MDNLVDRHVYEQSRIIRNFVTDAVGETLRQFGHFGFDQVGRFQRVGARLQINSKGHRRFAVEIGIDAVVLRTEFDPRHVFQTENAALVIAFKNNVAEFLFVDQTSFGVDRIGIGQIFVQRFLTELAGRKLRILFLHGGNHVLRRHVKICQLVR